jgi:hypothetical protein
LATHCMTASTGEEFEVVVDDDRRITDVVGPWPEGDDAELELRGDLPAHAEVEDVPDHIQDFAASRGIHVCMYDPIGCRTCYCDNEGNTLYCKPHC